MQLGAVKITKSNIVCAVGNDSGEVITKSDFDLISKEQTLNTIIDYFKAKHIKGIGIGLSQILQSEWSDFDLVGELKNNFKIPIVLDSYTNTAILGELYFGSCKNLKDCIYITSDNIIETGVIKNNKLVKTNIDTQDREEVQNLAKTIDEIIETYEPQKVVIEISVNNNMLDLVRQYVYTLHQNKFDNINDYIVLPQLDNSSIKGALVLIRKIV